MWRVLDIYREKGEMINDRYQLYGKHWIEEVDGIEFYVHIEIYDNRIHVHYETHPYIPLSKLIDEIKEIQIKQRDVWRKRMENLPEIDGVTRQKITTNAELSIASFRIGYCNGVEEYYARLKEIYDIVDNVIQEVREGRK